MAANDLVSLDEAKRWLDIDEGDVKKDGLLETVITHSSTLAEEYIGRQLVTRGTLTEYHTFANSADELYTLDWPIIAVTSVHEDVNRAYTASELLTVTTDYVVSIPVGKIIRVASSGSGTKSWLKGFRAVKVIYTAGYADTASIPVDIKDAVLRHISMVWREVTGQLSNLSNVSDAMGSFTRYGPAMMTTGIKNDLGRHRRFDHWRTGERDS